MASKEQDILEFRKVKSVNSRKRKKSGKSKIYKMALSWHGFRKPVEA